MEILILLVIIILTLVAILQTRPWMALILAILAGAVSVLSAQKYYELDRELQSMRGPIGTFHADLSAPGENVFQWKVPKISKYCHAIALCIETEGPVPGLKSSETTRAFLQGLSVQITVREGYEVVSEKKYTAEDINPLWNLPLRVDKPAFRLTHDLSEGDYTLSINVLQGAPNLKDVKYDLVARVETEYLPIVRTIFGFLSLFFLGVFAVNGIGAGVIFKRRKRLM